MKRSNRASIPKLGPGADDSTGELDGGRCTAWPVRAAPRCHGGVSDSSARRSGPTPTRWTPARSTESSPLGLSPCLGTFGSFDEITPAPNVCNSGRRNGGSLMVSSWTESNDPDSTSTPHVGPASAYRRLPDRSRRRSLRGSLRRCARWPTACRPHPGSSTERPWSVVPPCGPDAPSCG